MNTILSRDAVNEQTSRAMDVVKKTLSAAHELSKVKILTAEIRDAKNSSDWDKCYSTAQRYLQRYRLLINSYSFWTSVQVIDSPKSEAESKNAEEWKSVLDFIEMILYLDTALKYGAKTVIEHEIKRIFQAQ